MTFKEYIASRRITDTPAGDFTSDARDDKTFPDVKNWSELERYLTFKAPAMSLHLVLPAARTVWRAYQVRLRKLA